MPRIQPAAANETDATTQSTLNAIKAKIGMVPNLHQTFAKAPAVLNAYLAFGDALGTGVLSQKQREIIALATAQSNGCHYCLSAHTLLGKGAGLTADQIEAARRGEAADAADNGIAALAVNLVETRGALADSALSAARQAGLNDAQILEVVAHVAYNTLTNFTNNVAQTEIDFPVVEFSLAA
jgi:uncharacterized peroxidase-related enzyme